MSKSRMPAPKYTASPAEAPLSLHSEVSLHEHEEEVGWVRWIFQSIRARCEALVFQTVATERSDIIEDWKHFVDRSWLPSTAPLLLRAWSAAREGKEDELFALNAEMEAVLSGLEKERSITAGHMLLKATHGAKYQGSLGTFRRHLEQVGTEPQLAAVWAALAALFQLPPADLLAEHLREEWLVATKHCAHHEFPQGPLSFSGLAARALHEQQHFQVLGE